MCKSNVDRSVQMHSLGSGKTFKPFDLEWCPNCEYGGIRDSQEIDTIDGIQTTRHWCEECGWEGKFNYIVKFIGSDEVK